MRHKDSTKRKETSGKIFLILVFLTHFHWFFSSSTINAHPHIFAEARLDVIITGNKITSLRHVWRFDDMFSSAALMDFDQNRDGQLNEEELEKAKKIIYDSLKEYDYFQLVLANNHKIAMKQPKEFIVSFEKNQLIILFESEPKDTLKASGTIDFTIYDPSMYTAIEFIDDKNMAFSNIPQGCTHRVVRPDPDEEIARSQKRLDESFFKNPRPDIARIFSPKLQLDCPPKS